MKLGNSILTDSERVTTAAHALSAYKYMMAIPELQRGWEMASVGVTSLEIASLTGLPLTTVEDEVRGAGQKKR